MKLLIEPINLRDIPGFFLSTTTQAERILDKVGSDNLYIQYDFYHMQIMQGDLIPTFTRLKDRIAHVQIADNPGRNEPGTGEINYRLHPLPSSTASATTAGSAASTSRRPAPARASAG